VVIIHDLHGACKESEVQIPEKSMMMAKGTSDLNSLLTTNKVSLLTREQTPWPRMEIYNMQYKWKKNPQYNLAILETG